ncbi:MAG TPA: right-handed parallel beta-helix repeat-containing protein [Acidobacteriaceae bacterium]|nr:right-handed parallel beta-helix repeat-containing protein [Acidobacteriaceae bacterium]
MLSGSQLTLETESALGFPAARPATQACAKLRPVLWCASVLLFSFLCVRSAQASVVTCDPTTNTLDQCVQTATSNGTVPGTVVLVPNASTSLFLVSSTVNLPSNLTIRCEEGATIQQNGAAGSLVAASSAQNVTIDGCVFDGSNGSTPGLVLNNVTAVRVTRNMFQNFRAQGISGPSGDWTDVEIDGNVFNGVGPLNANDGAIGLFGQNGTLSSSNVSIRNNTCNNLTQGSGCIKLSASVAHPLTQVTISGNVLNVGNSSAGNLGIELFAVGTVNLDSAIQQFTVAGNKVTTTPGATQTFCISVYGSHGTIVGNSLSNCQAVGIEVLASYTSVIGNSLANAAAITWDGNNASHAGVIIADNNLESSHGSAAIDIVSGLNGAYALNSAIVTHNIVRAPAGATTGILVQTLSSGRVSDVHIDDNLFDTFGSSQRVIDSEGSVAQVQIDNNRMVNISGTGLFLNGGGTGFTIRLNYFNGTTWLQNFGTSVKRSVENIVNGTCCQ